MLPEIDVAVVSDFGQVGDRLVRRLRTTSKKVVLLAPKGTVIEVQAKRMGLRLGSSQADAEMLVKCVTLDDGTCDGETE